MTTRLMSKAVLALMIIIGGSLGGAASDFRVSAEITKGQAIARVRSILTSSTAGCRINMVNSIAAVRVKAGWRVTARLVMSASGRRISEKAVWIVSQRNGAAAQDQLTSEISNGCNN